jgi:Icc-related predicted phosphoesterase
MEARIGFAGDWHGNVAWANSRLQAFGAAGVSTVYQVGDFGLWPGSSGKRFLRTVESTCEQSDVQLFIVLGNHEDYGRVKLMRTDDAGWLYLKDYPRLRFATRGHTWVDAAGTRFAALGGAGSIDRNIRRPGVSWWPDEELTEDDCARLVSNVHGEGWQWVDVMITHEAPAGLRRLGITTAPAWLTPEVEAYCYAQRVRLREAMDEVAPRSLVHGHWHASFRDAWEGLTSTGVDYRCDVTGLPEDDNPSNAVTAVPVPGLGLTNVEVLRT